MSNKYMLFLPLCKAHCWTCQTLKRYIGCYQKMCYSKVHVAGLINRPWSFYFSHNAKLRKWRYKFSFKTTGKRERCGNGKQLAAEHREQAIRKTTKKTSCRTGHWGQATGQATERTSCRTDYQENKVQNRPLGEQAAEQTTKRTRCRSGYW